MMVVILTLCKCTPNHHVVHLKHITIRFVKCTPIWASLVAQLVKNLLAMWETWVQSLGCKDPLEKGTATHSSILAWRTLGVAKSQTQLRDSLTHPDIV